MTGITSHRLFPPKISGNVRMAALLRITFLSNEMKRERFTLKIDCK